MSILGRPQILLLLMTGLLLSATFLRPTLQLERPTYRYVFVFDISQSMNVMDVPHTGSSINRLDYAKQIAIEALSEFPCGTELGLAIFTGHRPFLLIKPVETCVHQQELSGIVSTINWRMTWEPKSEIAKGLYKSIRLMKQLEGQTRLVFFTDGHEAPPVHVELQPRFTGDKGEVKGLIVGVGGEKAVPIPKYDKNGKQTGYWKAEDVAQVDIYTRDRETLEITKNTISGTEHLSSLRAAYLQGLAGKTGLIYHQPASAEDLSEQMRTEILSIPKIITTDMRWLLALFSLLAFIAATLVDYVKNWPLILGFGKKMPDSMGKATLTTGKLKQA